MDVVTPLWPRELRLCFVTANILNGRSEVEAVRLIDAALDEGIRYFDTAPMYCGGHAERLVGPVAGRRQGKMFIATKVGMLPPSTSLPARAARRIARAAGVSPPAFAVAPSRQFKPAQVAASLQTSLRALGKGRIDMLLLHEPKPEDITDDLLTLLQDCRDRGDIGQCGLATGRQATNDIMSRYPGIFSYAQVPDAIDDRVEVAINHSAASIIGSHSLLGERFATLVRRLTEDDLMLARWQSMLDIDGLDTSELARLFLAEALDYNNTGPVLFSSGNARNVRANVRLLSEPIDRQRITTLRALVQGMNRIKAEASPRDILQSRALRSH